MNAGDIVRTKRELHWIDDQIPAGTRMRLISCRRTNAGPRWSGIEKNGVTHHNIPPEDVEWIA
jgi:hypothetical protein